MDLKNKFITKTPTNTHNKPQERVNSRDKQLNYNKKSDQKTPKTYTERYSNNKEESIITT